MSIDYPKKIFSISPQTKQTIAEFSCADASEVTAVVDQAWHTFENSKLSLQDRLGKILNFRNLVAKQADQIATLISREVGKPLSECYASEISAVLDTCVWLSKNSETLLQTTRIKLANPLARSKKCYIGFEPIGVVGVISPWNFPFSIPTTTILMAVAAGNTVILKPSEKSTLTAIKIAELFQEAGFEPGTVSVVPGDAETGKYLSQSRLGRLILTGSVKAGQGIVEQTASQLTPLTLELGGKDAAIVLPDAPVEFTANGLVWGAFFNNGQACASIERVYLVRGPKTSKLIHTLENKTKQLRVGPPEDRTVDIGPVIDQGQLEKIEDQVRDALSRGARLLTGGKNLDSLGGYYFEPTVLTDVDHSMKVMKEETFGPVLSIMVVDSIEEAIALANDSDFGLTASVWSASINEAKAIVPKLRVGTVYINECIFSHAAPELPWGGLKKSGIGRSHGQVGLLDLVNCKNTNIDTSRGSGRLWWFPYGPSKIKMMKGGIQLLHGSNLCTRLKGLADFASASILKRSR